MSRWSLRGREVPRGEVLRPAGQPAVTELIDPGWGMGHGFMFGQPQRSQE